jgi:hypothetical protein
MRLIISNDVSDNSGSSSEDRDSGGGDRDGSRDGSSEDNDGEGDDRDCGNRTLRLLLWKLPDVGDCPFYILYGIDTVFLYYGGSILCFLCVSTRRIRQWA